MAGNESPQILRSLSVDNQDLARFQENAEYILKNVGEGKILYNSGVKNKYHWRSMCYASQNFRAYYALETFPARQELIAEAFRTAKERDFVPRDYFKGINKVASFGCGPGSDLWGFKEFLKGEFAYSISRGNKLPRFTGFDSELGWMPFVEALDFEFSCKEIDVGFLREMLPQDVIIMSYFIKPARVMHRPPDEAREFWEELEKKANLIMVVNEHDPELHTVLTKRGYDAFQLQDELKQCPAHVYCLYQNEFALLTARRRNIRR
ncbi:uncharacterized protein LOC116603031 [Nematostella vectensis]|uniref:uncharacterized protein LOC116603031 n=1 Tax=Nematostella vectensis TaxID=45351 RepID=UPI002077354D|nr:uncharacterized protein LOC116603031 [Nematostella vectensis]